VRHAASWPLNVNTRETLGGLTFCTRVAVNVAVAFERNTITTTTTTTVFARRLHAACVFSHQHHHQSLEGWGDEHVFSSRTLINVENILIVFFALVVF